ncbi:MAG: hypothetical protein QGG00_07600 [Verrucomicrobiota bacterium]|jgi:hypothetical protein|nr:hypothetical protein [Verrucomicrobiota bacterium]
MSPVKNHLRRAGAILGTALFILKASAPIQADQNSTPDFKIREGKNDRFPGLKTALPRYVQVFGLFIQATSRVPDAKLLHAANIAADFLDNNRDGKPDNPKVNDELWSKWSAVVMGYSERELEGLYNRHGEMFDAYALQGLFATETLPDGGPHNPKSTEFDASIEEILHIITSVGYAEVYPDVFGERKGSELAKAMDIARGGYFRTVPRRYPSGAWYSYDDRTCDYGCQVTEYVYWALTSLLDGQDFRNRGRDINHEWKLNTPEKLRDKDKAVVKILTNQKFKLPTRLPDGKYRPQNKQAAIRLDIIPDENRFTLVSKLPTGSRVAVEKTNDLLSWSVARSVPRDTVLLELPIEAEPSQTQFFRLRFDD